MVELPRSFEALQSGGETGMSGRSKAKARVTGPAQSLTPEELETLRSVKAARLALVAQCQADPEVAKDLLRKIGLPSGKRRG